MILMSIVWVLCASLVSSNDSDSGPLIGESAAIYHFSDATQAILFQIIRSAGLILLV